MITEQRITHAEERMDSETLSQKAHSLLQVIKASGSNWLSRRAIAERMGKRYLNPVDILVLNVLAEHQEIEIQKRQRRGGGPVRYSVWYRAKSARPNQ